MKKPIFWSQYLFLLFVLNIVVSGSLVVFAQSSEQYLQEEIQDIYGVRWFLGDYFSFHLPQNSSPSQEMFILMFNSKEQLDDQIYLKINGTRYGCYERFLQIQSAGEHHYEHNKQATHEGQNFTNAMYKCVVYAQNFNGLTQVDYQIISGWAIFQGSGNTTFIKNFREYVLFEGNLRIPQNMQSLTFIFTADWGLISDKVSKELGYLDVLPSMLKSVQQNPYVGLLIFGGDLAYDFQGQMYIKMLTYLQPLTSQIAILVTPGNHESVYHEDSFQLYVESFYTPMWYKYFNYFSISVLESHKIVILSFDPEQTIFTQANRMGKNLSEVFEAQLNNTITDFIKKNYDVIVYSHYPIYCSEQGEHHHTCQQNKIRFQPFMKKFDQMGLDLYLSGHLHIYERSKQICNESNIKHNDSNIYDKSCPIYVIQGEAGNDMWVQMKKRYQLKNFTQTQVYGTGYGLATIKKRNITYEHLKVSQIGKSILSDTFTLYQKQPSYDKNAQNKQRQEYMQKMGERMILILQVVVLVTVAGLSFYLICRFRNKNKRPNNNSTQPGHVQMIQQNFQTPPNQNKSKSKEQVQID